MKTTPRSRLYRTIAWALLPGQMLLSVPTPAISAPEGMPSAAAEPRGGFSAAGADPYGSFVPDELPPSPTPPKPVAVNRTLPRVAPVPLEPNFSAFPTVDEIFRARVFEEPLVAVNGTPTPEQNRSLARVLQAYLAAGGGESTSPVEALLAANAAAPWRASLLLNLGIVHRRTGRPSRAQAEFSEAWALTRTLTDANGRAVADRAVGELAQLLGRMGDLNELRRVLAEVVDRPVGGTAAELLEESRQAAYLIRTEPERTLRCGPLALDRFLARGKSDYVTDSRLSGYRASYWGTSLQQLQSLAADLGTSFQMAKRVDHQARVVVPSIVHWSIGHFAALVDERDGRYLLSDPVFGGEIWISKQAYNEEMSGYALVPDAELPPGWRSVPAGEAERVWGRGPTSGGDNQRQTCEDVKAAGTPICCGSAPGMARFSVHAMLVSLNITDTPVGYSPPRGPAVDFTVTYNHRDAFQPQIFPYWNLGTRWTTSWFAYVTDDPTNVAQPVTVYLRSGGQETHTGYSASTASYATHYRSRAVVTRTSVSPIRYQRKLPSGAIEEYGQPDGASTSPRKVMLTKLIDPQGNAVTLTYDADLRLVAISDALGQVTLLSYQWPSDTLKVSKVTDPFGRFATFEYDTSGRLTRVTDVVGIQSQFEYGGADFVTALTTPYGRTTFVTSSQGTDRWIEATDPLGATERVEYRNNSSVATSEPSAPTGFMNGYLQYRNTFYWDKRAWAVGAGDYSKARIMHWLHTADGAQTSGTLEGEKRPLENRVWYSYSGSLSIYESTDVHPRAVAQILDDGSTQKHQYEYNTRGMKTKEVDPLGRETVFVYGNNNVPDASPTTGEGLDLLQVKQKNGATYDVLRSYTYNPLHQPLTITDARGAVTTYTYNTAGQVLTVRTPPVQGQSQGPLTTFNYDTNGYLQSVVGPVPGASTTFTYDSYGRKRTSTDAAGLTLTYDYDALDRVTRVTYPDASYEQTSYKWLDADKRRDRLGRWTQTFYDALRRPVATRDAKGGTTQYQYGAAGCSACSGGGDKLTKLVDANGNATSWDYDVQGRVTRETRADLAYETYTYETSSSRLKQKTDRRNITTTFEYFLDGKLKRKSYSDTTPAVSYTYDPTDGLMLTAANGTDTLTWTYDNLDRVATEASVKNASSVGYTYDDAGNRATLSLGGSNYLTYGYDPYSRLTSITRGSNVFGFGYDTPSRRASMTYPNGVVTTYGYDSESRLTSIAANKGPTPITSFTYVVDKVGNRTRKTTLDWAEDYAYDDLYRLVSADRSGASPTRSRWAYDAVGNRTADQTGDASNGSTYNNLNQLQSRAPGGALAFRGTTNEPATVTIAGQPATTTATNTFAGSAPVGSGNTDVAVSATDASGNTRTNTYRVSEAGATASYTYDPNGNLASKTEGTDNWTYTWNAENQLTKVEKNSVEQARFAYDPRGRRVEKVAGGATTGYTYDGLDNLRELRGATSLKYVHGFGVDQALAREDGSAALTYYHADGLGSIVKHTNQTGVPVHEYRYDAWGNIEAGASEAGNAFTGREWDLEPGFYYYRARYYDPGIGRFLSEDPIGLAGGDLDVYAYVANRPTNSIDPSGLFVPAPAPPSMWVTVAAAVAAVATAPVSAPVAAAAIVAAAVTGAAVGYAEYQEEAAAAAAGTQTSPLWPPSGGDASGQWATSRGNQKNEWNDRARRVCGNDHACICAYLKCEYERARRNGDSATALKIKKAQKADDCREHR